MMRVEMVFKFVVNNAKVLLYVFAALLLFYVVLPAVDPTGYFSTRKY